jgi:iron complex outermembrane receptor protein
MAMAGAALIAQALLLNAGEAHAEGASGQVEEVVVTALKRTERLQDTPVAITAFTRSDLQARNITNLATIATFTPNLVFDQGSGNTGGSTSSQIYIRGIGQADFLFTTEPGVGLYIDGVYLPRAIGSMMELVDVERIEVLKGPQGTLFGKNSVGGAISVITQAPQANFGGRAYGILGSNSRTDGFASMDVPLAPDLLSKVSVVRAKRDGYVDRVNVGDTTGNMNSLGAAAQLLWTPNAALSVRVSGDYTRKRERAIANTLVAVDPGAPLLGLWNALVGPVLGVTYDARYVPTDPFVDYGTGPNNSDLDLWGVSATADYRIGDATLRSITAYRHQNADFAIDTDHSPITYINQGVIDRQRQFSQEFQITGKALDSRLTYVAGTMYFRETGHDEYRILFAPGLYRALESLPAGIIPGLGGAGNPIHVALDYDGVIVGDIKSNSYAAYVHGEYALTDQLNLTAGVRYSLDKKTYSPRFDHLASGVTAYDLTTGDDWKAWTPKFGLDYHWTPAVMTYVSASRGYKSGGFNGRSTTAVVATNPFAPEYVWTYEAGFKTESFDRRLVLNGAFFYSDYTNLQLLTIASDPNSGVVAVVENAGAAKIQGFELELRATPLNRMHIDAGLGYLDGKYTKLDPTVTAVTLDSTLAKTPKWTFTVGADYGVDLGGVVATARVDYSYRAKVQNVANDLEILAQPGFSLWNATLRLEPSAADWSVTLFGTNLSDKRYITNGLSALDSLGPADVSYGRPREWGVRLDYRF